MKRIIWVVSNNKAQLFEAERSIDASGGMKAICLMSKEALRRAYDRMEADEDGSLRPSVLIMDYNMGKEEDFESLGFIMSKKALTGVPLFFITDERNDQIDDHCYELGATIIMKKPLSELSVKRIERVAWQQEMTKNYENFLNRQAAELKAAKEIKRLNEMLEDRNKVLKQVFGKYFSENVVDVILENERGASLGGEKQEVAVIMADLRGFTSLSDNLSAEVVVDVLDIFLEKMTEIITKHKGTIIEFMGDAVLAIFGAPHQMDCPEREAIKAAITMQNSMARINEINNAKGYPSIEMGIGIHKGDVFVGNIGSEYMMRYNVIGQAVNICSRIQSYCLGGQILCSRRTLEDIEANIDIGSTFDITVKGVRGTIDVVDVKGVVEAGCSYCLDMSDESPLCKLDKPIPALIYEIQDKRVNTYAIHGAIEAFSEGRIVFTSGSNEINNLAEHIDVEIVVQGRNAYGKVINKSQGEIEIHFTFRSRGFMEGS